MTTTSLELAGRRGGDGDDDDDDDARWRRFGARVMSPARPRLAPCLVSLTGATLAQCERAVRYDPAGALRQLVHDHSARTPGAYGGIVEVREAWEMLAPAAWLGDRARAFETRPDAPPSETPPTLRAALALASDPEGVHTAEELGREAGYRLATVLAVETPARVVWRLVEPRAFRAAFSLAPKMGTSAGEAALLKVLPGGASASAPDVAERAALLVREHAIKRVGGCAWDAAAVVRWHLMVREAGGEEARVDPFAPLAGLWELGYAFDRLAGDAVVLVAPLA